MTQFSIYNWRIMIFKSDLPSNAKYIGCYLSTWMNEWGDNCYPSIKRICHETGLSNKTVIKYIQVMRDNGWLETQKKGFDGKAWAHNQYYPNIPKKAVEELHHLDEGSVTEGVRQCNSGHKAVEEVHTSSTEIYKESSTKDKPSPKKVNGIPYQKIVDLYHQELPTLPRVEKLTATRKAQIRQRWIQDLKDLNQWGNFFDYVSQSKFLTGMAPSNNGRKPFLANLEWLTKESNFVKISEENYHG